MCCCYVSLIKKNTISLTLSRQSDHSAAEMDEIRSSASPTTTTDVGIRRRNETTSSRAKKECLSFLVSLKEGFQYVKASIIGQAKKLTAENEREATEADLKAAKMQVEAADAAEDAKARLHKSA